MAKKDEYLPAVLTEATFPALNPETSANIAEVIQENLGDDFSLQDLERIKFPSGGMTLWTVQTVDGEKHLETLAGIVVAKKGTRQYWKNPFSGGGTPPDCVSLDLVRGRGLHEGVPCKDCLLSKYGSAVDQNGKAKKGQACKEVLNTLIILEGQLLPSLVVFPPTSLKTLKQYYVKMSSSGSKFYGAVTEFRLKKLKNADGIDYAETMPVMGPKLSAEQIGAILDYVSMFKEMLKDSEPEPLGPEFES